MRPLSKLAAVTPTGAVVTVSLVLMPLMLVMMMVMVLVVLWVLVSLVAEGFGVATGPQRGRNGA